MGKNYLIDGKKHVRSRALFIHYGMQKFDKARSQKWWLERENKEVIFPLKLENELECVRLYVLSARL